jgi:signal transduction histidine kinase
MLPQNVITDRGLREALDRPEKPRVEVFTEYLDVPRFAGESYVRTVATYLRAKYSSRPPEVIVASGDTALAFLLKNRAHLFPDTPVVALGATSVRTPGQLPADVVGSPLQLDSVRTIELAFRLHPSATHLVLITGASEWDRMWEARLRSEVPRFPDRAKTEFLAGLSTEALRKRLAELKPDAVVYTPGYFEDGDGKVVTPRASAQIIAAAAAAPVYGPYDTFIDTGVVGGFMPSSLAAGQQAGQMVNALLDGAAPASLRAREATVPTFNVDWRQVHRWGIDETAIPGDAIVRFREPTFWDAHQDEVIIAVVVIVLQSALIVALLIERRRRRIAEHEARAHLSEMAHMGRREAMGGLAASIAHELNQPLGAIHNNAGAAKLLLQANPPKLVDVTEILDDIQKDDRRASDVIARARNMLRKAEIDVDDLDLNEAITETLSLLSHDAEAKGVSLKTELEPGLPKVRADRVQAQQVILNLTLNAMEAVHDLRGAKRQVVVRSARASDKEAEVSVVDSGAGIVEEVLPRIFKPFVTSKPTGMGLGLSISRTIVEAHGGKIRAENLAGGGAAFHFTLPLASAPRA